MLDAAYQKTEAGRAEIKARTLPLSRSARNLLLMLDGTRSARVWLEMVRGTTEADLDFLLQHGLIAASTASKPAAAPVPAPAPTLVLVTTPAVAPSPAGAPAPEAHNEAMGYDELYTYLTENARQHLGLIKGYRLVLDVERCTDLAELRELAWKIVAEVDRTDGEAAADRVRLEMRL